MLDKKVKCVHCGQELKLDPTSTTPQSCGCGKVSSNNGVITEGAQGVDWVDVSPQLLNG